MNNRRFKKYQILFLILIISIGLSGCRHNQGRSPKVSEKSGSSEYPIVVEDYLAREVTIEKPISKIACGYAYSGHVSALLGRGDDIVAVVGGLGRDKMLTDIYPNIKDLPVPFSSGTINIEELLKAEPDIVFIKADTGKNQSEMEKLEKFNIPYMTIDYKNIEEQIESIRMIGKVLDEEEKAEEYIDYYIETIEYVDNTAKEIPEEERVSLYHSVNEATKTTNKESLPVDWLGRIGIKNVVKDRELRMVENETYATLEQIYLWDPEVIIANEPGVAEYILTDHKWGGLNAVKNKTVHQMPIGISRWGHHGSLETPLAMLWTSNLVYPEYYSQVDMEEETRDYYKGFYDLDLNEEEIKNILTGKGMRASKN